jgi:phosphonate transport system substrate-binding protein
MRLIISLISGWPRVIESTKLVVRRSPVTARGYRLCLGILVISITSMASPPLAAAGNTNQDKTTKAYRLGIFPYLAPRQTIVLYGPVASAMEQALDKRVKLESLPSFTDFTRALSTHTYDIALIQPFDYPEVVEKYGYLPLARLSVPLVTQLFVRADSQYQQLEDLRGTTIALPPVQSANARMTLRALLDNQLRPGRDVELRYFNSHDSCIQQVWIGKASACGTARPPINIFEARMQAKLRPIYDTPAVPHILFVAHPRVPEHDRQKLIELIVNWKHTEAGRLLLKNLGFPGFIPVTSGEYTVMRNYLPIAANIEAKTKTKASKELVLGIFPYFAPRQLAKNAAPVLPALSKAADLPVHLRTAGNFGSFMDNVVAAQYDIVLIQPFDYAKATQHGYLPLARMNDKLQGEFFVLTTSPVQRIADFNGKVVAFPPADSAVARLGRYALQQAGLIPGKNVTIDYRTNHDSCIQQVQQGAAAACITSPLSLKMLPSESSRNLHGIGRTESVPGLLFMAHQRLPEKLRDQLQTEIISWKDTAEGRTLLQTFGFDGFVPVNVHDYQNMPAMEVPR